jgi:hypothetical protein
LVCTDEVHIQCHKAILSISPLFAKYDINLDSQLYPVDYASKPFFLFLEILYTGKVTIENTPCEILFDLYHVLKQSDFHDLANTVVITLRGIIDENNCSKMMDFYFSASVVDSEFLTKIQEYARIGGPSSLCEIYVLCESKNPTMLKQVIQTIVSAIKQENSSTWLAALDGHEIDDQSIWEKLGTTINPDTFHLWNIFQNKLGKANARFDKMEKETIEKSRKMSEQMSEWQDMIEKKLKNIK